MVAASKMRADDFTTFTVRRIHHSPPGVGWHSGPGRDTAPADTRCCPL
ncbi:hypothetical protein HMPREF9946_02784 [Acetobacteraceae bacterium AT-5844]|nr:hypothetical protein HMPREF9946_02784 [Acetobacteraceae bacterium AT-5844]